VGLEKQLLFESVFLEAMLLHQDRLFHIEQPCLSWVQHIHESEEPPAPLSAEQEAGADAADLVQHSQVEKQQVASLCVEQERGADVHVEE